MSKESDPLAVCYGEVINSQYGGTTESPARPATGKGALALASFIGFGGIAAYLMPTGFEVIRDYQNARKDCPAAEAADYGDEIPTLNQLREIVAQMDFAMDADSYERIIPKINEAQSFGELEEVMDEALQRFDIKTHIGTLPERRRAWLTKDDPLSSHDSSALTLVEVQTASKSILASMSRIPSAYMEELKGLQIHFASNIRKSGYDVWGFFEDNEELLKTVPEIALDPEAPNVVGVFSHELQHALFSMQCGASWIFKDNDYDDFVALNPESFEYSQSSRQKARAARAGYVAIPYGATDESEDVATLGQMLFSGGYRPGELGQSSVLGAKTNLIVERLSVLEPRTRDYLLYLATIYGKFFPGDLAKTAIAEDPGALDICRSFDSHYDGICELFIDFGLEGEMKGG